MKINIYKFTIQFVLLKPKTGLSAVPSEANLQYNLCY